MCELCDRMVALLDSIAQAPPSGATSAATLALQLQQLIALVLWKATLDVLKQAGGAPERANAACWLLKHRDQLFLPHATFDSMLAEAGFKIAGDLDPVSLEVDEEAARKFLQSAIAPVVEQLARLFQNSRLARSSDIALPSIACWKTLAGTDGFGCFAALVQAVGNTTISSVEQWEAVMSLHADAQTMLEVALIGGKADIAGLLRLHKQLIDSLVSLCQRNRHSPFAQLVIDKCVALLGVMSTNLDLRQPAGLCRGAGRGPGRHLA